MNPIKKILWLDQHTCPAWFSFSLNNALRRIIHKPEAILEGLINPGDTVIDVGCGPGYFTVPMAEITGSGGRVIAVDLQDAMLEKLAKRDLDKIEKTEVEAFHNACTKVSEEYQKAK